MKEIEEIIQTRAKNKAYTIVAALTKISNKNPLSSALKGVTITINNKESAFIDALDNPSRPLPMLLRERITESLLESETKLFIEENRCLRNKANLSSVQKPPEKYSLIEQLFRWAKKR